METGKDGHAETGRSWRAGGVGSVQREPPWGSFPQNAARSSWNSRRYCEMRPELIRALVSGVRARANPGLPPLDVGLSRQGELGQAVAAFDAWARAIVVALARLVSALDRQRCGVVKHGFTPADDVFE